MLAGSGEEDLQDTIDRLSLDLQRRDIHQSGTVSKAEFVCALVRLGGRMPQIETLCAKFPGPRKDTVSYADFLQHLCNVAESDRRSRSRSHSPPTTGLSARQAYEGFYSNPPQRSDQLASRQGNFYDDSALPTRHNNRLDVPSPPPAFPGASMPHNQSKHVSPQRPHQGARVRSPTSQRGVNLERDGFVDKVAERVASMERTLSQDRAASRSASRSPQQPSPVEEAHQPAQRRQQLYRTPKTDIPQRQSPPRLQADSPPTPVPNASGLARVPDRIPLNEVFRYIDEDGDGFLNTHDIADFFHTHGIDTHFNEIDVLSEMVCGGGNAISYVHFCSIVSRLRPEVIAKIRSASSWPELCQPSSPPQRQTPSDSAHRTRRCEEASMDSPTQRRTTQVYEVESPPPQVLSRYPPQPTTPDSGPTPKHAVHGRALGVPSYAERLKPITNTPHQRTSKQAASLAQEQPHATPKFRQPPLPSGYQQEGTYSPSTTLRTAPSAPSGVPSYMQPTKSAAARKQRSSLQDNNVPVLRSLSTQSRASSAASTISRSSAGTTRSTASSRAKKQQVEKGPAVHRVSLDTSKQSRTLLRSSQTSGQGTSRQTPGKHHFSDPQVYNIHQSPRQTPHRSTTQQHHRREEGRFFDPSAAYDGPVLSRSASVSHKDIQQSASRSTSAKGRSGPEEYNPERHRGLDPDYFSASAESDDFAPRGSPKTQSASTQRPDDPMGPSIPSDLANKLDGKCPQLMSLCSNVDRAKSGHLPRPQLEMVIKTVDPSLSVIEIKQLLDVTPMDSTGAFDYVGLVGLLIVASSSPSPPKSISPAIGRKSLSPMNRAERSEELYKRAPEFRRSSSQQSSGSRASADSEPPLIEQVCSGRDRMRRVLADELLSVCYNDVRSLLEQFFVNDSNQSGYLPAAVFVRTLKSIFSSAQRQIPDWLADRCVKIAHSPFEPPLSGVKVSAVERQARLAATQLRMPPAKIKDQKPCDYRFLLHHLGLHL